MKKCIILNKVFNGGWLKEENNIAHEIVNFFLTDNKEYYVYNAPHGNCSERIWINNTDKDLITGQEEYEAKYLILTDKFANKKLKINYVIELDKKLHNFQHHRKYNKIKKNEIYERNKDLIQSLDIKYCGKYLYEIFDKEDQTEIQITFKAKKIYAAKDNIEISLNNYNFARVRGYMYEDIYHDDYLKVINKIESSIKNNILQELKLEKLENQQFNLVRQKTFIDFIMMNDNEQIFTNIFYQILSFKNIFSEFYKKFVKGDKPLNFNVQREVVTVNKKGRMDIYAESSDEVVIIENKINSLLNGVNPEESKSQLKEYWLHAKSLNKKAYLFLLIINSNLENIDKDIKQKDFEMYKKYKIISYKDMVEFIKEMISKNILNKNFIYFKYLDDLLISLQKYSLSLLELYSTMLSNAINAKK